MRLCEINNQISFDKGYVNPVLQDFTQSMLDNKLYVDDDSRSFKKWWLNPEKYFEKGGVFSMAYNNDEPIGIGALTIPKEGKIYTVPNHNEKYVIFGTVGFFVKPQYRKMDISNQLAIELESAFINSFSPYATHGYAPVVFCSRMACDIAEKQFRVIITDKELKHRLEKIKNETV